MYHRRMRAEAIARRAILLGSAVPAMLSACGARSELSIPSPVSQSSADASVDAVAQEASADEAGDTGLCLERPAADCSCQGDACDPRAILTNAIRSAVSSCFLPCSRNSFSFDRYGCLTRYEPPLPQDDPCIAEALSRVRFPCAVGTASPFLLYNVAGSCGS